MKFGTERGQSVLLFVLVLGIFLLGFIALAVDYSNLWFHRQTAQSAADSACIAAASDMLVRASGGATSLDAQFDAVNNIYQDFDCSDQMALAPCQYAKLNGYNATAGLKTNQESTQVRLSFHSSMPGITTDPKVNKLAGNTPYVRARVSDRTRVFFASLITGQPTQDVGASAGCGLLMAKAPIPIIVLNPTCSHAFEVSGSATLKIVGGPVRSVQVNSVNATCAAATTASSNGCGGNGTVDLSLGGPNFSGSQFGVYGAPANAPKNFSGSAWTSPATPILDPYSGTPAPTVPSNLGTSTGVPYGGAYNCPDHSGCTLYSPGLYTSPIVVGRSGSETAIFLPGIYYIQPTDYSPAQSGGYCGTPGAGCSPKATGKCQADLLVLSGGVVRPAVDPLTNDPTAGALFYLSGSGGSYGAAAFVGNAGTSSHTIDKFVVDNMICPGGTRPPNKVGIPSQVDGNVLMGMCTSKGTYLGPGSADTSGTARGLLFFQDHANGDPSGQMNLQGSGAMLLAGTLYSHATNDDAFIQLQGTPGSGTYIFGEIITDELVESGNGAIAMQLSPDATVSVLKVQLLQ